MFFSVLISLLSCFISLLKCVISHIYAGMLNYCKLLCVISMLNNTPRWTQDKSWRRQHVMVQYVLVDNPSLHLLRADFVKQKGKTKKRNIETKQKASFLQLMTVYIIYLYFCGNGKVLNYTHWWVSINFSKKGEFIAMYPPKNQKKNQYH